MWYARLAMRTIDAARAGEELVDEALGAQDATERISVEQRKSKYQHTTRCMEGKATRDGVRTTERAGGISKRY